jgi:trans-2-enoyl-CoA reductase
MCIDVELLYKERVRKDVNTDCDNEIKIRVNDEEIWKFKSQQQTERKNLWQWLCVT